MKWSNGMKAKRNGGFTLVEIAIVVLIIALLALLVIPNIAKVRTNAQRARCLDNLRQINGAVQQYMLEESTATVPALASVTSYFQTGNLPTCPANGTYSPPATPSDVPTCSLGATLNHILE